MVKKEVPCIIMSFRGTGRRLIVEWTHELLQMRANQRWSLEVSDARSLSCCPPKFTSPRFWSRLPIITLKWPLSESSSRNSLRIGLIERDARTVNYSDYLRRNSELKYCYINVSSLSKPYGLLMASRSLLLDWTIKPRSLFMIRTHLICLGFTRVH